jgi:hypothetical protein
MTLLHRRYEVRPRWSGSRWELHIPGVGVASTAYLSDAPFAVRTYIETDLGHRALEDAEIVVLDPVLTIEREDSAQFA